MIVNPYVGQIVRVPVGRVWALDVMRDEEYVIVKVADYRPQGLPEVVVVLQDRISVEHFQREGFPLNPEYGAYLDRAEVTAA